MKGAIELRNVPLENIIYADVPESKARAGSMDKKKIPTDPSLAILAPNALVTPLGVQRALAKMQVELDLNLAKIMIQDVRNLLSKFEVTYLDFIDFTSKIHVNIAF